MCTFTFTKVRCGRQIFVLALLDVVGQKTDFYLAAPCGKKVQPELVDQVKFAVTLTLLAILFTAPNCYGSSILGRRRSQTQTSHLENPSLPFHNSPRTPREQQPVPDYIPKIRSICTVEQSWRAKSSKE